MLPELPLTVIVAAVTVSASDPVVPPPGLGLNTVIAAVPALATSARAIAAERVVAETYVVGRDEPLTRTTEADVKPAPDTLSVNAAEPAGTDDGDRLVIDGTGFDEPTVIVPLVARRSYQPLARKRSS